VLVKMLQGAKEDAELRVVEGALQAVAPRARDQMGAAVVPTLDGAGAEVATALFRVLGRAGGAEAAKVLSRFTDNPDARIRDEAVRTLANWADEAGVAEAAEGLLKIAKATQDARHQAMALRSYIGMARSQPMRRNAEQQLKVYGEALKIAKRPEEKRDCLGGLGELQDAKAVGLAASCLQDKDVAEEAAAAVVRIAGRLKDKADADVQAALAQVAELSKNEGTRNEARKLLIKKP
jgi:hypothetical protein